MITTVTAASSITSVTTSLGFGMAIFGIIAAIAFIIFLCIRELAAATGRRRYRFISRGLDIGIVPLAITLGMIVTLEIMKAIT